MSIRLAPDQLEALADLVARRLEEMLGAAPASRSSSGLVDAATLAARLGVSRDYVYEHAADLGALRVGSGARPRLRFDAEEASRRLASCEKSRKSEKPQDGAATPILRRRARRRLGTSAPLLPVKEARGG